MTSYFQDGSHDVRPPLAAAYALASSIYLLDVRRQTLLARCMCYSF